MHWLWTEAATQSCSIKEWFLPNFTKFTEKHLCQGLFFIIKLQDEACNFVIKESLAQVFSYEFCKISKNTFFTEPLSKNTFFTNTSLFLVRIFLYSDWIQENRTRNNYVFVHFSRSVVNTNFDLLQRTLS